MPPYSETSFHVRYAETDKMGVVHHSRYFVWMEEGRSAYLRERGYSFASFEEEGVTLAVTVVQARYIAPAIYDRLVTVRTRLAEMKSRSLKFAYEIIDAESGRLLVSGETEHICIDRQNTIRRIPDHWRGRFLPADDKPAAKIKE